MRIIDKQFYLRPATELAPELLGKTLCRRLNGKTLKMNITETEAYGPEIDTACHVHKSITARNKLFYARGGHLYVYLCYGIHNLVSIICNDTGIPNAVLIRGAGDIKSQPGVLTKRLNIDKSLYGHDLTSSDDIWLEDSGISCRLEDITCLKRIGIGYASDADKARLWRYKLNEK